MELEDQVKKLEQSVNKLAEVLSTTAVFVNALIKFTKIPNKDLHAAIIEASMVHAEGKRVRPSDSGTVISNSRDGAERLSSKSSDRNHSTGTGNTEGAKDAAPVGDQPVSSGSNQVGESGEATQDAESKIQT